MEVSLQQKSPDHLISAEQCGGAELKIRRSSPQKSIGLQHALHARKLEANWRHARILLLATSLPLLSAPSVPLILNRYLFMHFVGTSQTHCLLGLHRSTTKQAAVPQTGHQFRIPRVVANIAFRMPVFRLRSGTHITSGCKTRARPL